VTEYQLWHKSLLPPDLTWPFLNQDESFQQ